ESLLNEYQSQINQILKVSFDHLSPASVKKCFAYCSIFPQDTELGEDELIQHWVAKASIRTLFLHLEGGVSTDMLLRFKCLHVLKLSGYDVKFLPSSIGKLLHLRLLNISSSGITSLPESLCKLYNLQTLTMRDDALQGGFPKRMSDLISLRHLNYYHNRAKFKMPAQMGRLTCLQTLEFFNVSQKRGCGIEELGTLKYLKGSLEVRNLGLVKGKEAAKQAKLFEKPDLSSLKFMWDSEGCDEDVLEGLQPHPNLQQLEIDFFMGNKFPQWLINLPKLVELQVCCCKIGELPALGQLPSLKCLLLTGLDNIRSIGDEFYRSSTRRRKFFPALEELRVEYMENLVEWKDADQKCPLPCLERLSIWSCNGLTTISDKMFESCRLSLRSLKVGYCRNLVSFSLNLQEMSSLEEFTLVGCPKLIPHRFNGFAFATSLRKLWIGPFSSDDSSIDGFDWSGLRSASTLRDLRLQGLPHTESLPHQLQYLTTLTSLTLADFEGIEALPDWIGNLVSLETLKLWSCEKLRSLPSEAAMRRLTKLTHVDVYRCPLLRQRYTP
ncbi:unnamed protein product, partial [Coffea canephora]